MDARKHALSMVLRDKTKHAYGAAPEEPVKKDKTMDLRDEGRRLMEHLDQDELEGVVNHLRTCAADCLRKKAGGSPSAAEEYAEGEST